MTRIVCQSICAIWIAAAGCGGPDGGRNTGRTDAAGAALADAAAGREAASGGGDGAETGGREAAGSGGSGGLDSGDEVGRDAGVNLDTPARADALPPLDGAPPSRPLPNVDATGARCSGDGWCWIHPAPIGSNLNKALVLADNDIVIGGEGGTVLRFDGTHWRRMNAGTNQYVTAMAGSGPNDIWVFPHVEAPRRWDGQRWNVTPSGPATVGAAWAFAPDQVWAVSGNDIFFWDGQRWTKAPSSPKSNPGALMHMWAAGHDDIWVAGERGSVARWQGTTWAAVKIATTADITSLWGTGPNDVWIRTSAPTQNLFRFDGQGWKLQDGPPADASKLIFGPAGPARMIALQNDTDILMRENGQWKRVGTRPRALGSLPAAIAGAHPDHLWIVGFRGLLERFDGAAILGYVTGIPFESGLAPAFDRILGTGPSDVWVFGRGLWRWNGRSLQVPAVTPPLPSLEPRHIFGQDQKLWMVFRDIGDEAYIHPWNGTDVGARMLSLPRGADPKAAWANGPDAAVIVDGLNTATWDGQVWGPGGSRGTVIWGPSLLKLWSFTPGEGFVWERTATTWQQHFYGQRPFRALHGTARNNLWVVGDYSEVHQFDGEKWTPRPIPVSVHVYGVFAFAPDDVYVVGERGTILHWSGASWRTMQSGVGTDLFAVWGDGADGVWVAGEQARLLHLKR